MNYLGAHEDDQIEVVAKTNAPIAFDVQYLDASTVWWDCEDKEFIGGEREVGTLELEMTFGVRITIDPKDRTIAEVDWRIRHLRAPTVREFQAIIEEFDKPLVISRGLVLTGS